MIDAKLPHLRIDKFAETLKFKGKGNGSNKLMRVNRGEHYNELKNMLDLLKVKFSDTKKYLYLTFYSYEGYKITADSLDGKNYNLCRVFQSDQTNCVVASVNEKAFSDFGKKLEKYISEVNKKKNGTTSPKHNSLIANIKNIVESNVTDLWNDDLSAIPDLNNAKWCEVWFSDLLSNDDINKKLKTDNIEYNDKCLEFQDTIIKKVKVNQKQLNEMLNQFSGSISEFRVSRELPSFFTSLSRSEESEWIKNLKDRVKVNNQNDISVCILDTGINNKHPLLEPMISSDDCYSYNETWGNNDIKGHGTEMAGVTIYGGNLSEYFETDEPIEINHIAESVKILPDSGENKKEIYGDIISQAISRVEINKPNNRRIICMAVTAPEDRKMGQQSAWSATIDKLVYNYSQNNKRLFFISAGNSKKSQSEIGKNYFNYQLTDEIHDPAQAWNAITVGGYTDLDKFDDTDYKDYSIVAQKGQISPYTTTSVTWRKGTSIKPDIVMEAGNLIRSQSGVNVLRHNDLDKLTTAHDFIKNNYLTTINGTSLSVALASKFAADLINSLPRYKSETIRGLIIHSASWTEQMQNQLHISKTSNKKDIDKIMRVCGYGVPNLEKARFCANNRLTLIAENSIQPFNKGKNNISLNEMHLYRLPIPSGILMNLQQREIDMRVTLSYFIEPYPRDRGGSLSKYRYSSYGLKFELKRPSESEDDFIQRVSNISDETNDNESDNNEGKSGNRSKSLSSWVIGSNNRHNGSIHSDIWRGTPTDLASSNLIAIYPRGGWWKTITSVERFNEKVDYSLIISIETDDAEVDIYSATTKVMIGNKVLITT